MTDNHIESSGISFLQTTKIIVLTGSVVMVMAFFHTGRKRAPLLSETEEPMTTIDFAQFLAVCSTVSIQKMFQRCWSAMLFGCTRV